MAGGAIARAIRGLFWTNALLAAVLWRLPTDLPPAPPQASSSSAGLPARCAVSPAHHREPMLLRYILFALVVGSINLTLCAKVHTTVLSAAGVLPEGRGRPPRRRCASCSSSSVGLSAAGVACTYLVEIRLGVVLACLPRAFRGAVYGAMVLAWGVVCYWHNALTVDAMSD